MPPVCKIRSKVRRAHKCDRHGAFKQVLNVLLSRAARDKKRLSKRTVSVDEREKWISWWLTRLLNNQPTKAVRDEDQRAKVLSLESVCGSQ